MSILSQIKALKESEGFSTKEAIGLLWAIFSYDYAPISRYYVIPSQDGFRGSKKKGWYLRFKLGKFEKWVWYRTGRDLFNL